MSLIRGDTYLFQNIPRPCPTVTKVTDVPTLFEVEHDKP